MVNRTTYSGSSTPPLSGPDFLDEYAERLDTLFDASALPLTAVGGTANAVTATLDPPLASAGVFVDGMKFTLTWAAENTAGVTLAINGGAAVPVVDKRGTALNAGALTAGLRSLIEFVGGSFRVLTEVTPAVADQRYWQLTVSGSWTKPSGLDDDQIITVEAWGGGGGGGTQSNGAGGGGGGYVSKRFRAADVPATVSFTIGAGGSAGAAGANTLFGALLTAFGGGFGGLNNQGGGGGGGEIKKGGNGSAGAASPGAGAGLGGSVGGGDGGNGLTGANSIGSPGSDARTIWGGGGGGGSGALQGGVGGDAVFGGGGGGASSASGGVSLYGGNGGAAGAPGQIPGGGGGRQAAGARGEIRIYI